MDFLKKLQNANPTQLLKFAAIAFAGVFILMLVSKILNPMMPNTLTQKYFDGATSNRAVSEPAGAPYYGGEEMGYDSMDVETTSLSMRNIMPQPPADDGYATGDDAEAYEITSYSASIETRDVTRVCDTVAGLKSETYVIFEFTNIYDRGCNFTFKVETERVGEVLPVIEGLEPKDLSVNSETIKQLVEDYTSQEDILKSKLASIDETLTDAVSAYDEIATLARRTQDVESLTTIINNKVTVIERLTQERINITAQLERINRSKEQQLDRLEYTYFSINVYEQVFVDGEALKDSWKRAIKQSVHDVNEVIQQMTVGLISFVFLGLQLILYFFLLLFVAKYGWRITKKIWNT
jgi:hypothetical protein